MAFNFNRNALTPVKPQNKPEEPYRSKFLNSDGSFNIMGVDELNKINELASFPTRNKKEWEKILKAKLAGSPEALHDYALSIYLLCCPEVSQFIHFDQVFALMKKSAENFPLATLTLGYFRLITDFNRFFLPAENIYRCAFEDFKKAADQGLAEAQYKVFNCLQPETCAAYSNLNAEEADEMAYQYCKMAAIQGHPQAFLTFSRLAKERSLNTDFKEAKEDSKLADELFKKFKSKRGQGTKYSPHFLEKMALQPLLPKQPKLVKEKLKSKKPKVEKSNGDGEEPKIEKPKIEKSKGKKRKIENSKNKKPKSKKPKGGNHKEEEKLQADNTASSSSNSSSSSSSSSSALNQDMRQETKQEASEFESAASILLSFRKKPHSQPLSLLRNNPSSGAAAAERTASNGRRTASNNGRTAAEENEIVQPPAKKRRRLF